MDPTIAVVGDSYVWRLEQYLKHCDLYNMNLPPNQFVYLGQGGASVWGRKPVVKLVDQAVGIRTLKLIYLNIGSNDLCDTSRGPFAPRYIPGVGTSGHLAWSIYCLAKYALWASSAQTIIIGQIHPRLKEPYPLYNIWVQETNDKLHCLCTHGLFPIQYNYIQGLQKVNPDNYVDMVHFTPAGNYKMYKGLRGAAIRALASQDSSAYMS